MDIKILHAINILTLEPNIKVIMQLISFRIRKWLLHMTILYHINLFIHITHWYNYIIKGLSKFLYKKHKKYRNWKK